MATLDFAHDRKMMSVLCRRKGQDVVFTKGAPEAVLDRCIYMLSNNDGKSVPMSQAAKAQITAKVRQYGKMALRCIALALKPALRGSRGSW